MGFYTAVLFGDISWGISNLTLSFQIKSLKNPLKMGFLESLHDIYLEFLRLGKVRISWFLVLENQWNSLVHII